MNIEVTILISVISLSFALYSGLKSMKRTDRKDAAEDAAQEAAIMVKLETINSSMIEMKTEMKGYKDEVQKMTEKAIRNEESLKSLHKRVDRMEQVLQLKPPTQE